MAPKRGMSAEDKRKTLLAIFHETKDVFVLKVGVGLPAMYYVDKVLQE